MKDKEIKEVRIGQWNTNPSELLISPLASWELTKCFDGEIRNAIQLNYGLKNISILIPDDLYQEIGKMINAKGEKQND